MNQQPGSADLDFDKLQAVADRVDARGLFNASCDIREWIASARDAIAASRRAAGGEVVAWRYRLRDKEGFHPDTWSVTLDKRFVDKMGHAFEIEPLCSASLPDVAMPEKIALVEASNALRLVRKYPNMDFIERDKMLDAAIARVSEALAAQPAEGSAQPLTVSVSRPATINWDGTPAEGSAQVATSEQHPLAESVKGAEPPCDCCSTGGMVFGESNNFKTKE